MLNLILLGATAAIKGGAELCGFAMSKFAIRAMAQSLSREFGPKGVHVAHAVIDGLIDTPKTKGLSEDVPDSKIDPEWVCYRQTVTMYNVQAANDCQIAESYWFLHTQPRTSFTHEIDLRPYSEKW